MKKEILVDIVIPLYNEETVLAQSVKTLSDFLHTSGFPYSYVITLANNASTDNSWNVCVELAGKHPHVKALDIGSKGKGRAIRTAWGKSSGHVLVFMDADLSSDLNSLLALVDAVIHGGHDMAIGSRLGKKSKIVSDKLMRKVASRSYNLAARLFLNSPFEDHQCGFKAIKKDSFRKVSQHLTEHGFFFDTELIATALVHGLKIHSIDILWKDSATSKVSLMKDSVKMFGDVVRLRGRLKKSMKKRALTKKR